MKFNTDILNLTNDAIFILEVLEDDFKFIEFNKKEEEITGIKRDDIIGKTVNEFFDKDIAHNIGEKYQQCSKEQKSINYEEELDLPSGKKYYETTLNPILDQDKVVQIIGISKDITRERANEQKMKRVIHDMGERIKEMNLLYELSRLTEKISVDYNYLMSQLVELIPPRMAIP